MMHLSRSRLVSLRFIRERHSSIDFDRLDTGVKVSFVTEPSPKGPRATNVRAEV
jgi:cold shock CspA family protein